MIDPGVKPFIKFFKQLKSKKIIYGREPYKKLKISLNKKDIAYNIRYHYNFALYTQHYENIFSVSLNTMLTYKNVFPNDKDETLRMFKKTFPKLFKFLPKNAKHYLRNTDKTNIVKLYPFFQKSLEFFSK